MPTAPVPQAFAQALQCHEAGRLADAEALYRQILAVQPDHAGALHRLGLLAHQHGRRDLAVELIRQAVALAPNDFAAHSDLGEAYRAAGRIEDAIASYQRALQLQPGFVPAHYNLGNVLLQLGRGEEAIAAYHRALHFQPGLPEAWNNLGTALRQRQSMDEAIAAWRRAIELRPDYLEAHTNLGAALAQQRCFEEALATYRRVLELRPDYPQAHLNLGNLFWEQGQRDEAVTAWRRAVELKPDFAEGHYNLGNAFKEQGRFEEAVAAYRRALQDKRDFAEARNNLGDALLELGRFEEADAACREALRLKPDHAGAKYNLSVLALLRGDYEAAWPGFERRWEAFHLAERRFSQPRWDGTPLHGQRVLVHAEQGLGDSIQFIRYAALMAARGGEVIVECQRSLVELFRGVKGVRAVVAAGDALPPFDRHVPMLSLPAVCRTTREIIPQDIPYLFAEPARCAAWRQRLGGERSRWRVGLVWAGNPKHARDRLRSLPYRELRPLLEIEEIDFFSVQKGGGAGDIQDSPTKGRIIDHTGSLVDFADTAAFLMEMDLVISVDTAVAHLAGALGRPVWTLLSFVGDWRWGTESEKTPWYPTMRLFRQTGIDDWETVMKRVAAELGQAVGRSGERTV